MSMPAQKLLFMSMEHVDLMNRLLADDAASLEACAALARRYTLAYELSRDGGTVWWTMEFDPKTGVRFGLVAPEQPADLTFHGGYRAMLDATARTKAGEQVPMPLTPSGDLKVMEVVGAAFAAARSKATIDTEIREI
jgi:hypothetical protein